MKKRVLKGYYRNLSKLNIADRIVAELRSRTADYEHITKILNECTTV